MQTKMSDLAFICNSTYCYDSQIFTTLTVATTTKKGEFVNFEVLTANKITGSKLINNLANNILLNINFNMASISL